jgi:hypothetical protein
MVIEYLTDEIKITEWMKDSSITGIAPELYQIASEITSINNIESLYINGFQIITFLKGTYIPGIQNTLLAKDIIAEVLYTKDGVIIRAGNLDEDGYGIDLSGASQDFLTSLYDRYISLLDRQKKLSNIDKEVLQQLEILLEQT